MKSRREAAFFVNIQLGYAYQCPREKGNQSNYGRQELRELLDFIYEGGPKNEAEIVRGPYAPPADLQEGFEETKPKEDEA